MCVVYIRKQWGYIILLAESQDFSGDLDNVKPWFLPLWSLGNFFLPYNLEFTSLRTQNQQELQMTTEVRVN